MKAQDIRNRIADLCYRHGVSQWQVSHDLGHSGAYISNITTGKTLPSMQEFLSICEYFNITPEAFFSESQDPVLICEVLEQLRQMTDEDVLIIRALVTRIRR